MVTELSPTNTIGYLLQHLSSVLAKQSDQVLQERLGIGLSQFRILMTLQKYPRIGQRHIADQLGQTEASISRQIKLMHEKGLLQTMIAPSNRRQHLTMITPRGVRLCDEALRILDQFHTPMLEAVGEKQQHQLLTIMLNMHTITCQSRKTGACDHPFNA